MKRNVAVCLFVFGYLSVYHPGTLFRWLGTGVRTARELYYRADYEVNYGRFAPRAPSCDLGICFEDAQCRTLRPEQNACRCIKKVPNAPPFSIGDCGV